MTGSGILARRRVGVVAAGLALCFTACAPPRPPLYGWGEYEPLLYEMWVRPGAADPATAAARLEADIRRLEAGGRAVPPGVHAHLGWLYWLGGLTDAARAELTAERLLFPESAVMIDDMLARLDRAEGAAPAPDAPPTTGRAAPGEAP